MFSSLCYLLVRCLVQLVLLRPRSHDFKELEIVVLRHQLAVLRRQTHGPQLTTTDRVFLAAAKSVLAALTLEVVSGHANDAAALAPATDRPPVDVRRSGHRPQKGCECVHPFLMLICGSSCGCSRELRRQEPNLPGFDTDYKRGLLRIRETYAAGFPAGVIDGTDLFEQSQVRNVRGRMGLVPQGGGRSGGSSAS